MSVVSINTPVVRRRRRPKLRIAPRAVYVLYFIEAKDAIEDGDSEFVELCSSWDSAEARIALYAKNEQPKPQALSTRKGWLVVEREVDQEMRCGTHRLTAPARWYSFGGERLHIPCRCAGHEEQACDKECTLVRV